MLIVGLTGGIGSGKSTAAKFLQDLGIKIIDADFIAHQLSAKNQPAANKIIEFFGPACLTVEGELDRSYLRQAIFSNPDKKIALEAILHPMILAACRQQLSQIDASTPYAILMAPLLLEISDFKSLCHKIVCVSIDKSKQIARVMKRSNFSNEEVNAILENQLTDAERKQQADYLIYNNESLSELQEAVVQLDQQLKSAALNLTNI